MKFVIIVITNAIFVFTEVLWGCANTKGVTVPQEWNSISLLKFKTQCANHTITFSILCIFMSSHVFIVCFYVISCLYICKQTGNIMFLSTYLLVLKP